MTSVPPAPQPPPGWYPDPSGANTQRYFDGTKWTDQLAPFNPPSGPGPLPPTKSQPKRPSPAKSPRRFVIMAIAGPIAAFVTFVIMQLAFGAADSGGSGTLMFQIIGFVAFLL
ncbi:MAG: DUF2510 domain-containing protein, partial [Mycobacterium sp.]|uniref:DUF2510 domain-containing protein n=1 Tax=Mycobacterium sp. TaxID=1785 RepID=UPI003C690ABE